MKYFLIWLAILCFLIILFPLCLNVSFHSGRNEKNAGEQDRTDVYLVSDDKVVTMNTEDYIRGVLMAEMPAEFEEEALKAQAVAARTYMVQKRSVNTDKSVHKGADVCTDPSHCQAYVKDSEADKKWGKNASLYFKKCKNAVESTQGIIAVHENEPIKAVFHSISGGRTENAEDVWGSEVAYLKSVESPGEESAPKYRTKVTVTLDEFKTKLKEAYGVDFSPGLVGETVRSEGGNVLTIEVGNKILKGTDIRKTFSLASSDFEVSAEGDKVIFSVLGYGHGVGMSQYGANHYAKEGYDYKQILKTYYQGIEFKSMYE